MSLSIYQSPDALQVLRYCPGMISAYVELARCYLGLGMFEEAARTLQQCLGLQPNCAPVLVALAGCEAGQFHTAAADRVLEQALACDFAVRTVSRFRLVKAIIRAQQVKEGGEREKEKEATCREDI